MLAQPHSRRVIVLAPPVVGMAARIIVKSSDQVCKGFRAEAQLGEKLSAPGRAGRGSRALVHDPELNDP
jgi:hypothetical protein